jgi:hypothetical protein
MILGLVFRRNKEERGWEDLPLNPVLAGHWEKLENRLLPVKLSSGSHAREEGRLSLPAPQRKGFGASAWSFMDSGWE